MFKAKRVKGTTTFTSENGTKLGVVGIIRSVINDKDIECSFGDVDSYDVEMTSGSIITRITADGMLIVSSRDEYGNITNNLNSYTKSNIESMVGYIKKMYDEHLTKIKDGDFEETVYE